MASKLAPCPPLRVRAGNVRNASALAGCLEWSLIAVATLRVMARVEDIAPSPVGRKRSVTRAVEAGLLPEKLPAAIARTRGSKAANTKRDQHT